MRFTGRVSDERVAELLRTARALVVTAAEEFGIAAVEALASGRPVIALGAGGVLESVREGETGAYYERDDPEALAARGRGASTRCAIDPAACVARARRFGTERFRAAAGDRGRGGRRRAGAAAGRAARGRHRAAAAARRRSVLQRADGTAKSAESGQDSSVQPKTSVQRARKRVTRWLRGVVCVRGAPSGRRADLNRGWLPPA